jgi:predicted acylesterase/phospholipase RssA
MQPTESQAANEATLEDCDLVMKGGITSGIVYPPAILELKRKYRFRNIGGSSAGAIAAAGAAAAEYGRQYSSIGSGFDALAATSDWLGSNKHLLDLFVPSFMTAPLLRLGLAVLSMLNARGWHRVWHLIGVIATLVAYTFPGFVLPPALVILVAFWSTSFAVTHIGWDTLIWIVVLLLLGFAGSVASLAFLLLVYVPKHNYFGICTGHTSKVTGNSQAEHPTNLTDWINASLNEAAFGRTDSRPVTFGDLESANIHLRLVTTSLGHEQPYLLPFAQSGFIFSESEMLRLFPESVVEQLKRGGSKVQQGSGALDISLARLPADYYFLPPAAELPIVVAARMSLSFPILLSAVPLYNLTERCLATARRPDGVIEPTDVRRDLQRNWFTDGGICSNFPITLFDAWLPSRPTFGINLTKLQNDAVDKQAQRVNPSHRSLTHGQSPAHDIGGAEHGRVYLPRPDAEPELDWYPVTDLLSFLGGIWSTIHNFRDTLQANLPSYRERIVQVRLAADEGGLNLDMDGNKVQKLIDIGSQAGRDLFPPPEGQFDLNWHRWTRTLVLMEQLEQRVRDLRAALVQRVPTYEQMITELEPTASPPYPYHRDAHWCALAWDALALLAKLDDDWRRLREENSPAGTEGLFQPGAPQPPSVLRVTPEI